MKDAADAAMGGPWETIGSLIESFGEEDSLWFATLLGDMFV